MNLKTGEGTRRQGPTSLHDLTSHGLLRFPEDLGTRSLNVANELWENLWKKLRVVEDWREINVIPNFNRGGERFP